MKVYIARKITKGTDQNSSANGTIHSVMTHIIAVFLYSIRADRIELTYTVRNLLKRWLTVAERA